MASPREILAKAGARKMRLNKSWLMRKKQLTRKLPLTIDAISVTCGGQLIHQLRPFVKQIKFLHPELPLHIATDPSGVEKIEDLVGPQDVIWKVLEKDLKFYGASKSQDHGHRWSKPWIGVKLENFRRAVDKFKCGVLQCDCDFVFNRALPKRINWHADVVMSTHRGPLMHNNVPDFHGNYNAGLLLSDSLEIANKWISLYMDGYGDFYEQKLLEKLDDLYVVDLFPSDWNWGGWRNQEDVKYSRRLPTFFHAHVTGPHLQDTPLHEVATKQSLIMNRSEGTTNKLAFYHNAKAAGTELMYLIEREVLTRIQYQLLNSFCVRTSDWNHDEMVDFAVERSKYQHGNRFIVHNHAQGWSDELLTLFRQFGWEIFALYRPIRERMASFYYWNIDCINKYGKSFMSPPIDGARTADDFFKLMIDPSFLREWCLPNRHDLITWYHANDEGLTNLMKDYFNLSLNEMGRSNASNNLGWDHLEPLLKPATLEALEPYFQAWDNFAENTKIK